MKNHVVLIREARALSQNRVADSVIGDNVAHVLENAHRMKWPSCEVSCHVCWSDNRPHVDLFGALIFDGPGHQSFFGQAQYHAKASTLSFPF